MTARRDFASGKIAVDKSGRITDIARMTGIEQLLSIAHAYASAEGVELSTVSWRSMGDTKKLSAMEGGADIQVRRLEKTLRWFSANWPDAVEWPEGIARPAPEPPPGDAVNDDRSAAEVAAC